MNTLISPSMLKKMSKSLTDANGRVSSYYVGQKGDRQPVHTVYGGAQLFKRSTIQKVGKLARKSFEQYGMDVETLQGVFDLESPEITRVIQARVRAKLEREAVEDFRIDFEDGFGVRSDSEEDETAVFAAKELAAAWQEGTMSPFSGIRIKSFGEETWARGVRTLDLFLTTLVGETKGRIDPGFVVTLPKITHQAHVEALVTALGEIEKGADLNPGTFKFEIMVETPQCVLADRGKSILPKLVKAGDGRCVAAHFGTYDYTASLDITANHQTMDHPACDFARHVMKVTLAQTGLRLSDGATNILPVPVYGTPRDEGEHGENRAAVYRAWRLSYDHIQHSLKQGIYQGWDLHPSQIPVRYVALYAFFLRGLASSQDRLRNFIDHAAKATLVGDVFDDAATGQGLLNFFLRAAGCGAITQDDLERCGLTEEELQTRSFLKIVKGRQQPAENT